MSDRLVLVTTSPRVAPGLLSAAAWSTLQEAGSVRAAADHPLLPYLRDAPLLSGLRLGLERVDELRSLLGDVDVRPSSEGYGDLAHALDLRASLVGAEASLLGALARRETRGAHIRLDHPDLDPSLQLNFHTIRGDGGRLEVRPEATAPVPEHMQEWAKDEEAIETTGRLLE